jgi:putative transposase
MARKLRLQFEGAIYHIINRGNYRRPLFETCGTKHAFRACLFEAATNAGWRLHAYALMTNHFHLAVETPRENLVEGMHWLLSTFGTRFNRFRSENGHLFQGRYKSLLVEPGPALARVVNYVHLNPVRAGLVNANLLESYPWTSLGFFLSDSRPPSLVCTEWLRELQLQDRPEDWRENLRYLQDLAANSEQQNKQGFGSMTRGWAIGTSGWRAALARDRGHISLNRGYRRTEVIELRSRQWEAALERLQRKLGRINSDSKTAPKGAPWKVDLAIAMRAETTAPLSWIASRLHMGTVGSVSHYLYLARHRLSKVTDLRA